MTSSPRKIAVVGIDGCGKSTVIRRFLELSPLQKGEARVIHCPLYHTTPNSPLSDLSRQMDAFSQAADRLGSFELKAAALYLQMTLYGPIESFFLNTFHPQFLLSERHALVDSLAYGPFYGDLVQKDLSEKQWGIPLKKELNQYKEKTFEAIQGCIYTKIKEEEEAFPSGKLREMYKTFSNNPWNKRSLYWEKDIEQPFRMSSFSSTFLER